MAVSCRERRKDISIAPFFFFPHSIVHTYSHVSYDDLKNQSIFIIWCHNTQLQTVGLLWLHADCKSAAGYYIQTLHPKETMSTQLSSEQLLLQQKVLVACRDGDRQVLEACLEDPCDHWIVNIPVPRDSPEFSGQTALHVVCTRMQVELLLVLLREYLADPNALDIRGTTALTCLVRLGTVLNDNGRKVLMVQLLLQYEADPNAIDLTTGQTALHVACEVGCLPHLQRLVAFGGHVDKADHQGWTPLAVACSKGHFVVAQWLLSSARANPNKRPSGRSLSTTSPAPLAVTCRAENVNLVSMLLQYGADLQTAIGASKVIDVLTQAVNDQGQTVLHCLCSAKTPNVDVIHELLAFCGARIQINSPDYKLRSPLHHAAQTNSVSAVRRLLQEPHLILSSPDIYGNTPLALTESVDVASELLLDERLRRRPSAEVHRPNHKGITPIQRACKNGWTKLARVLLENGANPNVKPSPLFHPSHTGDVSMVDHLLAHGADPNGTTIRQRPLLAACCSGYYTIVMRLLGAGADANVVDPVTGATALHLACQGGHADIVEYLVREGRASLDARDRRGCTPLDVAKQFRRREDLKGNAPRQIMLMPELPPQTVSSRVTRKYLEGISYWKEQKKTWISLIP